MPLEKKITNNNLPETGAREEQAAIEQEPIQKTQELKPPVEKPPTREIEKAKKTSFRPAFVKPKNYVIPRAKDEITLKIEKIMEEDLQDAYQRLSPVARVEFKLKGERTAAKIRELMSSTRAKVKKILRLIYEWLKMLPGVNRFFLEQEAKIKTDKIIALKNRF